MPQAKKVQAPSDDKIICRYEHRDCDHPLYLDSQTVVCHPECVRQYVAPSAKNKNTKAKDRAKAQ